MFHASDPTHPPALDYNWGICVLCQVVTDESSQCPLKNQLAVAIATSLAEDLFRLQTLQLMPMDIILSLVGSYISTINCSSSNIDSPVTTVDGCEPIVCALQRC